MGVQRIFLFMLAACEYANAQYHDNFTRYLEISPGIAAVFWKPGTLDSDWIQFEIAVRTKGWLGLGLAPTSAMQSADIVVMWIDSNGRPQISDRHGPTEQRNAFPPVDVQQDYEILAARENDTHTIFQIRRRMNTCDTSDWKITANTTYLLLAYNNEKPISAENFKQHEHSTRFHPAVKLMGPETSGSVSVKASSLAVLPAAVASATKVMDEYCAGLQNASLSTILASSLPATTTPNTNSAHRIEIIPLIAIVIAATNANML